MCGVFLGSALNLGTLAPVAAVTSAILAISGRAGAKFITKIKRTAEVEYTDRLLPGYGGVLDRVGSLVGSLIILYHVLAFSSGSTA